MQIDVRVHACVDACLKKYAFVVLMRTFPLDRYSVKSTHLLNPSLPLYIDNLSVVALSAFCDVGIASFREGWRRSVQSRLSRAVDTLAGTRICSHFV